MVVPVLDSGVGRLSALMTRSGTRSLLRGLLVEGKPVSEDRENTDAFLAWLDPIPPVLSSALVALIDGAGGDVTLPFHIGIYGCDNGVTIQP